MVMRMGSRSFHGTHLEGAIFNDLCLLMQVNAP